jgi:hypothetical protein
MSKYLRSNKMSSNYCYQDITYNCDSSFDALCLSPLPTDSLFHLTRELHSVGTSVSSALFQKKFQDGDVWEKP